MRPGWVAGVTRGRLLLGRTIGPDGARRVAGAASPAEAVGALAGSAYGERVVAADGLAATQRAIAETLLWHLRILAGWLPAAGAAVVRTLAGWFEIANVDARLGALAGDGREPRPYRLGGLATAWPALDRARTVGELGEAVDRSAWGSLPGHGAAQIATGMRAAWLWRVSDRVPDAADWAAGAAVLLLARIRLLGPDAVELAGALRCLPALGEAELSAASVEDLRAALPARARWPLEDVNDPGDLWSAELRWWRRVEDDAQRMLRARSGETVLVGVAALLAADAQRAARALATAVMGPASKAADDAAA